MGIIAGILESLLFYGIVFGIPLASIVWTIINVIKLVKTIKKKENLKRRIILLIISIIVMVSIIAFYAYVKYSIEQSVAHM